MAADGSNFMAAETGIRFSFDGDSVLIQLPNRPPLTARRQAPPPR